MSKTPEQILDGHGMGKSNYHLVDLGIIMEAMQEYADQEVEKALSFVNKDIQTKNRGPYENR